MFDGSPNQQSFQDCDIVFGLLLAVLAVSTQPFSPVRALPSHTGHGPNAGILPVSEYVYSNYAFWNWVNNQKVGMGTQGTDYETN